MARVWLMHIHTPMTSWYIAAASVTKSLEELDELQAAFDKFCFDAGIAPHQTVLDAIDIARKKFRMALALDNMVVHPSVCMEAAAVRELVEDIMAHGKRSGEPEVLTAKDGHGRYWLVAIAQKEIVDKASRKRVLVEHVLMVRPCDEA